MAMRTHMRTMPNTSSGSFFSKCITIARSPSTEVRGRSVRSSQPLRLPSQPPTVLPLPLLQRRFVHAQQRSVFPWLY